jgi:hypothetical protein
MMEEEIAQSKQKKGSQFQDLFISAEGKPFDPAKKFGTIEDGT